MDLLKERIMQEGRCFPGGILKVDSFVNHQMDPILMMDLAKEFVRLFNLRPQGASHRVQPARHTHRASRGSHRQRIRQGRAQQAAYGVCRRGAEATQRVA